MRQGSNNRQTKRPEWEVTAKENTKRGECFAPMLESCDGFGKQSEKKGRIVFKACHAQDDFCVDDK